MSSVRSLAYLFCTTCDQVVMHRANVCIECDTQNQDSGNPPVPRPRIERRASTKHHDPGAVRRARAARHQILQRGRT